MWPFSKKEPLRNAEGKTAAELEREIRERNDTLLNYMRRKMTRRIERVESAETSWPDERPTLTTLPDIDGAHPAR